MEVPAYDFTTHKRSPDTRRVRLPAAAAAAAAVPPPLQPLPLLVQPLLMQTLLLLPLLLLLMATLLRPAPSPTWARCPPRTW